MGRMEEIRSAIERRSAPTQLKKERKKFRDQIPELTFDQVSIKGLNEVRSQYVKRTLHIKEDTISMNRLRAKYFHVFTDDKIKYIFPDARYNPNTSYYTLELEVVREKDIIAQFGGNFSSRPINTGYIGLQYNYLGNLSLSLGANSYFGRFYTSVQLRSRLDLPLNLPFYIEPIFTMNRWDYFKSTATFFEDTKPPFLIQNDRYAGLILGMPAGNKGRIKVDGKYSFLKNEYYQSEDFTSVDTADQTRFENFTAGLQYERSSLNRKQYPTKGSYLRLSTRYVSGGESTIPGSTALNKDTTQDHHEWVQFKVHYENYFKRRGILRLGFSTEGVFSTQPFFDNYTGTILSAPAYQPIPESKTLFQDDFRAYKYIAGGLKSILKIDQNLDLRMEGYIFQPVYPIHKDQQKAVLGSAFERRYFMGTGALVYHSPLGPISLSINYYDNQSEPFSFLFNFGYIIFNDRSFE